MPTLFPVIQPPAPHALPPNGPGRVRYLAHLARIAVTRSAEIAGAPPPRFVKSPSGAPRPESGWFWSLTHKPGWVAGVTDREPVGIDLEEIRPVRSDLHLKICDPLEWNMGSDPPMVRFFRYWTAKEAVLKAAGVGFSGLSQCRVVAVPGPLTLFVSFKNERYRVEQLFISGHLAALASRRRPHICWKLCLHPSALHK